MSNTGLVAFIVAICTIGFVVLMIGTYRYLKAEDRNAQLMQAAELQAQHLRETEAMKREILRLIDQIEAKIDDAAELEKLAETYRTQYRMTFCGQPLMDALLSFKIVRAERDGISFDVQMGKLPDLSVPEGDLTALLGNLVDNAMEAAVQAEEKWVRIASHHQKGQWILRVDNGKSEDVHPLENGMQTTKEDTANHGMGTKIINRIVKKNKGTIVRKDQGRSFHATVAFDIAHFDNTHEEQV